MNNLVSLKEVVQFHYGSALKSEDRNEMGPFEVFGSNGPVGRHSERLVDHPTIIIGRKGSVGSVYYAQGGGWPIDTTYYTKILDQRRLHLRYLFYALNQAGLDRHTIVTSIPGLNRDALYRTKIPLPPLPEQKRIADILDKADAIRRKRREAEDILVRTRVATFHSFFGDPVLNPNNWGRQPLRELLESIDSGISPKCLERPILDGEWGILKLGAVTWCEYDWAQNKAIAETTTPDPSIEVKCGDLLFTRKNTYELVAAAAYVYQTPPRLMLPDLIFRLRIRPDAPVLPEFLWGLLTYPTKRRQIQALAGGAAGSMPNISKAKLLEQLVELPPENIQRSYARYLHQTRKLWERYESGTKEGNDLFNSLVQRAFRGEL